jgi:hypothetical protein
MLTYADTWLSILGLEVQTEAIFGEAGSEDPTVLNFGTQFTCFTSTKVRILRLLARQAPRTPPSRTLVRVLMYADVC